MEISEEFYQILTPSTNLGRPGMCLSIEYLSLDLHYLPRADVQILGNVFRVIPNNFPRLSYLNLEGSSYIRRIIPENKTGVMDVILELGIRREFIFRSHFNISLYRARTHRNGMALFYSHYVMTGFYLCPLLESFLRGCHYEMQELLRYGVQRIHADTVIDIYRDLGSHPLYERFFVSANIELTYFNLQWPTPFQETYSIHRSFLVIEMLHILDFLDGPPCEEWKNCYRLLWRSVPDPYLSLHEIRTFLHHAAYGYIQNDIATVIARICCNYSRHFPEINESVTTPRSLVHLCRCAVRYCMRQSYSLPHGINRLRLPQELISFLKLEK